MPDTAAPLASLLRAGRATLDAAGIEHAGREVRQLWAALCNRSPAEAFGLGDGLLDPSEADGLERAIARRAVGEPLPYVTGIAGFRLLELLVDRRVLIPRPETEGLVAGVLARVDAGAVVDVGTGSGCIALSLAREGGYASVTGLDCSAAALAVARANSRRCGVNVPLLRGDLTFALADASIDALVSNPPYLTADEYAALDPSVRDWEPGSALVSGADGLAATSLLLRDGLRVVRPGGWIALEVDCNRAAAVAGRASAFGWRDIVVETDLYGRDRYLFARRSTES